MERTKNVHSTVLSKTEVMAALKTQLVVKTLCVFRWCKSMNSQQGE